MAPSPLEAVANLRYCQSARLEQVLGGGNSIGFPSLIHEDFGHLVARFAGVKIHRALIGRNCDLEGPSARC